MTTCSTPSFSELLAPAVPAGIVQNKYFTPEQLAGLDRESTPVHVAIIPDGNRRWAKKRRRASPKVTVQAQTTSSQS